ncbi:MAG TPA: LAGLIDADG family homing endonuclease [Prolixibacteraceae bacterium]|nr:LAGLIDADG family homing endonuclease [Prolixibacteraceae bacterium]
MTWEYISGFFDADGSITAVRVHSNTNKTIQVSFHNNEIEILEVIKSFIFSELGIMGSITRKKCKKPNHGVAFDLKYSYRNGLLVANRIISYHQKKKS